MGAFKSEKGLPRDYSGVSPPPDPDGVEDELWSDGGASALAGSLIDSRALGG